MSSEPRQINTTLVQTLIADQFPAWARLPIQPVSNQGWDNRSFRVGGDMLARLPSAAAYAPQVHREQHWLPYLRPYLPLEIPEPLALGRPGHSYPWSWSIYKWISGSPLASTPHIDVMQFAEDLALFLRAMRNIPTDNGPKPGADNFHRGGSLEVYEEQCYQAIAALKARINSSKALTVWNAARATAWTGPPVWVHGDIAPGNLLVREGKLAAVIDFGQMCIGDPACDFSIAWTYLRGPQRRMFKAQSGIDADTWARACAWAFWKAAIVLAGITQTNQVEQQAADKTITEILGEL